MAAHTVQAGTPAPKKRDRTHWLYIAVIIAVVLGIIVGFAAPEFAVSLIKRTQQATKAGCLVDFPDPLKALAQAAQVVLSE